jgi:hypothetical protein
MLDTIVDLREASYVLSLVVVVIAILAIVRTHFRFGLNVRGTGFLLIPAACLFIVAVYRVVQAFSHNSADAVRSSAAFWVLQITFEL